MARRMVRSACSRRARATGPSAAKIVTARFYADHVLSQASGAALQRSEWCQRGRWSLPKSSSDRGLLRLKDGKGPAWPFPVSASAQESLHFRLAANPEDASTFFAASLLNLRFHPSSKLSVFSAHILEA